MTLAIAFDTPMLLVGAVVGIVVLGVAWFAMRFWLVSTRPPDIKEVKTPTLDRLNAEALGQLDDSDDDDDDAPGDLPQEAPRRNGPLP